VVNQGDTLICFAKLADYFFLAFFKPEQIALKLISPNVPINNDAAHSFRLCLFYAMRMVVLRLLNRRSLCGTVNVP
jgi:hypothetical protein